MRSRKSYYIDDDANLILDKMVIRTRMDKSKLVNDAIRLAYTGTSQLSEEDVKERERIFNQILQFFANASIKTSYK